MERFYDPFRKLAAVTLLHAISDYANMGIKRYRHRCRTGRDWVRRLDNKSETYVPPVYQDLYDKVWFIYSRELAHICDELELDLEHLRIYLLLLLVGPNDDT